MQINFSKKIKKIFSELEKLDKFPRTLIFFGAKAAILLLLIGTLIFVSNHTKDVPCSKTEVISTNIITSSFTILAEFIIGGLVIDYVLKR